MNLIYFLIDKDAKQVLLAGDIPGEYGQMAGLKALDYNSLRDLSWAQGYEHLAFMTYDDAKDQGISVALLDDAKEAAISQKWAEVEPIRQELIQAQRWRIERHNDETLLGIPHKEDIVPVAQYIQKLRDLPTSDADPFNIVWPDVPPLPV